MAGERHGQRSNGKRERWLRDDTAAATVETMEKGVWREGVELVWVGG